MGTRRRTASARGTSAAWVWWDARRAHRKGPEAIRRRQQERLAELVAFAREHSAYYRRLYQGLPERIEDVAALPVTDKRQLMAHFDEVATDPAVTLEAVQEFVADPVRIGERFAGKYLVATTAGSRCPSRTNPRRCRRRPRTRARCRRPTRRPRARGGSSRSARSGCPRGPAPARSPTAASSGRAAARRSGRPACGVLRRAAAATAGHVVHRGGAGARGDRRSAPRASGRPARPARRASAGPPAPSRG